MSDAKDSASGSVAPAAAAGAGPALRRLPHESQYQFEMRSKLYDAHVGGLGHDRAETLCVVWSNMKFLRARYSKEVEAQVIPWGGRSGAGCSCVPGR